MREALHFPAHQRAPETHTEPAPPAGNTLRKSALNSLPTFRGVRSPRKSNTLPSLRLGAAPLDKNTHPLSRPCFSAGMLDTDLFARAESVAARRLLGLRALPAAAKNDIAPLATTCEQGSAAREPVVHPGSTALIDLSPTAQRHAGSDARAGADERSRRMDDLEKDKRELFWLFASRRDAGFVLDVTPGTSRRIQRAVQGVLRAVRSKVAHARR